MFMLELKKDSQATRATEGQRLAQFTLCPHLSEWKPDSHLALLTFRSVLIFFDYFRQMLFWESSLIDWFCVCVLNYIMYQAPLSTSKSRASHYGYFKST